MKKNEYSFSQYSQWMKSGVEPLRSFSKFAELERCVADRNSEAAHRIGDFGLERLAKVCSSVKQEMDAASPAGGDTLWVYVTDEEVSVAANSTSTRYRVFTPQQRARIDDGYRTLRDRAMAK